MKKINWTDGVRNEEVLHSIKKNSNILRIIKREGRLIGLVTSCIGTVF
jgi:hypothetical protein